MQNAGCQTSFSKTQPESSSDWISVFFRGESNLICKDTTSEGKHNTEQMRIIHMISLCRTHQPMWPTFRFLSQEIVEGLFSASESRCVALWPVWKSSDFPTWIALNSFAKTRLTSPGPGRFNRVSQSSGIRPWIPTFCTMETSHRARVQSANLLHLNSQWQWQKFIWDHMKLASKVTLKYWCHCRGPSVVACKLVWCLFVPKFFAKERKTLLGKAKEVCRLFRQAFVFLLQEIYMLSFCAEGRAIILFSSVPVYAFLRFV